MVTKYFKILFIVAILIKRISPDVKLYNAGSLPKALALIDNTIGTFLLSGYLKSKTTGEMESYSVFENRIILYKFGQFPDGSFIAYNGLKIFLFSASLKFLKSETYSSQAVPGVLGYISAEAIDNDKYLLSAVINKLLTLSIFDKSIKLDHVLITKRFAGSVHENAHCSHRITKGYICMFIEDVEKRFLSVLIVNEQLIEVKTVTAQTRSGASVKFKKTIVDNFLVCYLTTDTDAYCSIYDDSDMTLTNPTFIAKTGNYDEDKIDIGILSDKELLFVYASSTKGELLIQKLTNKGVARGSVINSPIDVALAQMSTINYLVFPNRLHGIVYGLPSSIYFKELNVPYCFDYCSSIKLFELAEFDLSLYSTLSSTIKFTNLPSFSSGKIYHGSNSVSIGTAYQSTVFKLLSYNFQSISSAKYLVTNSFGNSVECLINIFIGLKGNCKCPQNTFTFYDQCLTKCPSNTYSDSESMVCINCASNGQFLYNGDCIDKSNVPDNTFVSDKIYNVLEECASFCVTCSGKADKCIACVPFDLKCPISCSHGTFYSLPLGNCKSCYDTCASCSDEGNVNDHKCDKCITGYEIYPSAPNKCQKTCSLTSLWYLDDNKEYNCIFTSDCPSDRPIFISKTYQCVESCSKTSTCIYCQISNFILKRYKNSCVEECPPDTLPNDKQYSCDKIPNIEINITDKPMNETLDDLNSTVVAKPNITIIIGDNYTVEIYNSTSQGGNLALSKVDFGKCEKILRKEYSIPDGEILIFVKFDIDRAHVSTNQVEYQVRDSKGNLLNLKFCEKETVDITYQIKNSSILDLETAKKYEELGIDIYNSEDPFFTDLCFPFTTDNGTDIILRDRLKDIYQNISVCEESCTYKGVDLENMTVTCSCSVKVEVKTEVNTNAFTQSLTSVFTNSNFMVVTCYNLVFDSSIILTNFGFWFCLVMIVFHLPNWLYYFVLGVYPITKYFSQIPKSPPKKDKDYIDRIISEGNIDTKSINHDLDEDSKLKKFKKSQVLLSQSHTLLNIITPSAKQSQNENKKSLFTLTKKTTAPKYSKSSVNTNDELNPKENSDNNLCSNSLNSQAILNQSNKSNNVNIIQSKNDDDEFNINSCSIYSTVKENTLSSFCPKVISQQNNENNLNHSTYSNYVNNSQNYIDSNMSPDIYINNNKLNLSNIKSTKTNKSIFEEKHTEKKGIVSSKFNPVKSSNPNNKIALTATSTMNDSQTPGKSPFNINLEKGKDKIIPSMDILDDFDLMNAQMHDTRSFWRLFWISLKAKHPILSTFVMNYHFSLRSIIIITFIFGNIMDFAFNAFFYSDDLISNRYHYEGNLGFLFDLQNNIVISIASFAVSLVIGFFLNLLSTSESKLEIVFNSQQTAKHSKLLLRKVIRCLKIKLLFFIILELVLTLFFWYYMTAFCAVYQSSQWSWLSGGMISFLIGLLFPLPIALGIILVRKFAIHKKKNCMFKLALWFYKL